MGPGSDRWAGSATGSGSCAIAPHWRRRNQPAQNLIDRLQLFPWLKPNCLPGWNANFGAGPGIASDACLAWTNVENAESSQLNAVTIGQGFLHAFEDRFHGHLSLSFGDPGFGYHFIDDIQLDHKHLQPHSLAAICESKLAIRCLPARGRFFTGLQLYCKLLIIKVATAIVNASFPP